VSAYDDNATSWSNTAEQWWSFFAPRPWLEAALSGPVSTIAGTDALQLAVHQLAFRILDTCGFPKDNFWYYRSGGPANRSAPAAPLELGRPRRQEITCGH